MKINVESPAFIIWEKCADTVIATLYYLLSCLPVVTIGASTTAMYSTIMAIQSDSCTSVTKKFFSSFKENLFLSTNAWLIMLALGLLLVLDYWFWITLPAGESLIAAFLVIFSVFFTALYLSVGAYLLAGIAKFKVTLTQAFHNASVFAATHVLKTILLVMMQILMLLLIFFLNLLSFPLCALLLYLITHIIRTIFSTYEA